MTVRGIGLPASTPRETIDATAVLVGERSYHSFWLNNPPGGNALELLGAVAGRVSDLWLGVGVIPLSHASPAEIAASVHCNRLPLDRFYLGIGSGGGGAEGLERVAAGIAALRRDPVGSITVAALGPRMCRLAAEQADAVLLNWLTPSYARDSVARIREAAGTAGRPVPRLMTYVRAALGREAVDRLQREAGNYEDIPAYAAHFRRMGSDAMSTTVTGERPEEIANGLAAWDGIVDEVVIRAVAAEDTLDALRPLVIAAAPSGQ